MEDAQDIDVAIGSDQVGDAVVLVEEDSHMAPRRLIAMAHFRKPSQRLRPLINAVDGFGRRAWIVHGDVLEDILEPPLSLCGPIYFGHERMRRAISSLEMTRPASESANPRSTIT